jgi:hypothetical protein
MSQAGTERPGRLPSSKAFNYSIAVNRESALRHRDVKICTESNGKGAYLSREFCEKLKSKAPLEWKIP